MTDEQIAAVIKAATDATQAVSDISATAQQTAIKANDASTAADNAAKAATLLVDETKKILAELNENKLKAAPATPPKTTVRYINDTIFASNFGSILVSLVSFSKGLSIKIEDNKPAINHSPTVPVLCYALFFLIFRIKAYLDDNASLIEKEAIVKAKQSGIPTGWQKLSFIFSIICWLLYSVSGYFVFTDESLSVLFLSGSLCLFILWIVTSKIREWILSPKKTAVVKAAVPAKGKDSITPDNKGDSESKNHLTYLWSNLAYIILLFIIFRDSISESLKISWLRSCDQFLNTCPITTVIGFITLLTILAVDFVESESLNSSYK